MAFTFLQLGNAMQKTINESDQQYFDPEERSFFITSALYSIIKTECEKFDNSQEHKTRLLPILKSGTFTANPVVISTSMPKFLHLAYAEGKFDLMNCFGVKIGSQEREIKPCPLNSITTVKQDPLNKPTNRYPLYTFEDVNGSKCVNIYSDTAPLQIKLSWVEEPVKIDIVTDPAAMFQFDDSVAYELIKLAAANALDSTRDFNAAAALEKEIPQASGTFAN